MLHFSNLLNLGLLSALVSASFALPWASTETQGNIERADTTGPRPSLSSKDLTTRVRSPPLYPVECFEPGVFVLEVVIAADCEVIINEIILRLNDPMRVLVFGFNETADVDLSLLENRNWHHGQCVITLDSQHEGEEDEEDRFRLVDVAIVAQSIIRRCVVGSKDALGGHADIGSPVKNFFVIVGGIEPHSIQAVGNHPRLSLFSSNVTKELDILNEEVNIKDLGIRTRSNSMTNLTVTDSYNIPMTCIRPGMPAAGNIKSDDCLAVTETLLSYPDVLIPQTFTTEPSGGIHVPNVHRLKNCFLTINTNAPLSKSNVFTYIKVAYYASEIMRRCSLGGVAKLTPGENGFYVSLTGVDPVFMKTGLSDLLNSTTSGLTFERSLSSQ